MISPWTVFRVSVTDASRRPLVYFNTSAMASGYFTWAKHQLWSWQLPAMHQHSDSRCKASWLVASCHLFKSLSTPDRTNPRSINPPTKGLRGKFVEKDGIFQFEFLDDLGGSHHWMVFGYLVNY